MKNITLTSTAVLLMIISTVSSAQIYKWADENGQLHYTERPAPPGQKAEAIEDKIRLAAALSKKSKDKNGSAYIPSARETNADELEEESEMEKVAAEQKKAKDNYREQLENYCTSQRKNIEQLKTESPIAWEENGKTELLTAEAKKKKLKEISSSVDKNCGSLEKNSD